MHLCSIPRQAPQDGSGNPPFGSGSPETGPDPHNGGCYWRRRLQLAGRSARMTSGSSIILNGQRQHDPEQFGPKMARPLASIFDIRESRRCIMRFKRKEAHFVPVLPLQTFLFIHTPCTHLEGAENARLTQKLTESILHLFICCFSLTLLAC